MTIKENECGCAGIFNTINSIEILAQIFDQYNCLKNLESFVSTNSSNFYKLQKNEQKVLLEKRNKPIKFAKSLKKNNIFIKIYNPEFPVFWKMKNLPL